MPGPTHHYGGHATGNMAASNSKNTFSNPKRAALEWLEKVWLIKRLGGMQCILPPHRRPLSWQRQPINLHQLSSGFMWMANAGHFFPSIDTSIGMHQFIPSTMNASIHRNHETKFNAYWIKKITQNINARIVQPIKLNDEGAANSIRLWGKKNQPGLYIFVHGSPSSTVPSRQKKQGIIDICSLCKPLHSILLEQTNLAINAGVFHNDLISFGFKNKLFCHEYAFKNQGKELDRLKQQYQTLYGEPLHIIEVPNHELRLEDAVKTYVFNSQVITTAKTIILVCPSEVNSHPQSRALVSKWHRKGYVDAIHYVNIQSSLKNGGGPACLRLTIYLPDQEVPKIPSHFILTNDRYQKLKQMIQTTYPDDFVYNLSNKAYFHERTTVKKIEAIFY